MILVHGQAGVVPREGHLYEHVSCLKTSFPSLMTCRLIYTA